MVQDAFLLALPSLVNYYSLEKLFFLGGEEGVEHNFVGKKSWKNIFNQRKNAARCANGLGSLLHSFCPKKAQLSLQELGQVK